MSTVDPRPYTYEYRKPRLSNPTLYVFFYTAVPPTCTIVSTTCDSPPRTSSSSPGNNPTKPKTHSIKSSPNNSLPGTIITLRNMSSDRLSLSTPLYSNSFYYFSTRQHSVDLRERIQPENHTRNASMIK